jgi:hypothetical protein
MDGSLGQALLLKSPSLRKKEEFKRASIVIANRLAISARKKQHRFVMMVPPPSDSTCNVLCAGLLFADFVHKSAPKLVPEEEKGSLLGTELLLITHAVGSTIDNLREFSLGAGAGCIQDYWHIESFSRYYKPITSGARIFVANHGWIIDGLPKTDKNVAIIDATHPRTLTKVQQLLAILEDFRLVLLITPPLMKRELTELGWPERTSVWFWDPESKRQIKEILSNKCLSPSVPPKRSIWLSQDSEVDAALDELHDSLGRCTSIAGNKQVPGIREAWSLYHRLRQLSAPLPQVEDATFRTWGSIPFRKRIERLQNEWPETFEIEVRWPAVIEGLRSIYNLLSSREEPVKFWVIAERAQKYMAKRIPIRIVVPTEHEATILNVTYNLLIDGWIQAQQAENVEIVSVREEARRVSNGDHRLTILSGFRVGRQRYLDIYPEFETEVVAYPYEAEIELLQQDQLYSFAETIQNDIERSEFLKRLGLPIKAGAASNLSQRPEIMVSGRSEATARKARVIMPEPWIEIDKLASESIPGSWDEDVMEHPTDEVGSTRQRDQDVFVRFSDGRVINYAPWDMLDIYHSGTEDIRKHKAEEVQRGMKAIRMVDQSYDSLFDRLIEALNAKLGPYSGLTLELWNRAKAALFKRYDYKVLPMHRDLQAKGLSVDYPATLSWFRDERLSPQASLGFSKNVQESNLPEAMAPQQYPDFKVVAEHSGIYPNEKMIKDTFQVIREERGRRRNAGHVLHNLLRAIASGNGYDHALAEARKFDAGVGEVLAAVDVQEIAEVRKVDRTKSGTR